MTHLTDSNRASIDATDPDEWGPAVEAMAAKMAERMWGPPHWYRGVANDALTAALGLDPKDTMRVFRVWEDRLDAFHAELMGDSDV
jgi:hypothetical protein